MHSDTTADRWSRETILTCCDIKRESDFPFDEQGPVSRMLSGFRFRRVFHLWHTTERLRVAGNLSLLGGEFLAKELTLGWGIRIAGESIRSASITP